MDAVACIAASPQTSRKRHKPPETSSQTVCTAVLPRIGGPSCVGGSGPRCRQRSRLYSAMDQTSAATGAAAIEKTVTARLMSAMFVEAATPITRAGTKMARQLEDNGQPRPQQDDRPDRVPVTRFPRIR